MLYGSYVFKQVSTKSNVEMDKVDAQFFIFGMFFYLPK